MFLWLTSRGNQAYRMTSASAFDKKEAERMAGTCTDLFGCRYRDVFYR